MTGGQNLPSHGVGRILGLDVGARRIGLAISDPLGITAQGLTTLERRNRRHDLGELRKLLREYEVCEIVIGNPLRMSGQTGTQAAKMASFAAQLEEAFDIAVHLWDERLSTAIRRRQLRQRRVPLDPRRHTAGRVQQGVLQPRGLARGGAAGRRVRG